MGRSIVGAAFYPSTAAPEREAGFFPGKWRGKFFFADWPANWIKALDPDAPTNVNTFARGFNGPVVVEVAPDGALLVLNRGTIWRDGKKWQANSGSLVRIRYTGITPELAPERESRPPLARTLSAANLFASLVPLAPRAGWVDFEINAPPWRPGIAARRWISLPAGGKLAIDAEGEFDFSAGTIVMQHHSVDETGKPFETHVLWFTGPRVARAAAYRWTDDGADAALVEDGEIITLPGDPAHRWFSPGAEENLNLDSLVVGFLLPLNPRQINRGDQLAQWNDRGWFVPTLQPQDLAAIPPLAAITDSTAPLEVRVRSYLDVNCAACHRPGGPSRGNFDARFIVPLNEQNLLNGELVAGDLGIPGARVIVPGHPEKSVMLRRLSHNDFFRMPPVSVNEDAQPIVTPLKEWIEGMARTARTK